MYTWRKIIIDTDCGIDDAVTIIENVNKNVIEEVIDVYLPSGQ